MNDKTLDEWAEQYDISKQFIADTIGLGVEYSSESGELFGVFLVDTTDSELPYRVSWYDSRGFSGHANCKDEAAAVKLLMSDLGCGIKLAPGSMQRLFEKWD